MAEEPQPEKQEKKQGLPEALIPFQWKKGQSGNPGGKKPGPSMKTWVKNKLSELDDEERVEFIKGIHKLDIWKMGEGQPESKVDVTTTETPYDNLNTAERIAKLKRALEALGANGGQEQPDIPNGGDTGLPKTGEDPQGGGGVPEESKVTVEESSDITSTKPSENNGDNNIVDNSTVNPESKP